MYRSHKIRLYPNNVQETYFKKACGVARFTYNWGLAEWKQMLEAGEKVSTNILSKKLNSIKREQFPWMLEVTKCAAQSAIQGNLDAAFNNFFRGLKQGKKIGFPKFKKKGHRDSFTFDFVELKDGFVRVPKLGWVRLAENLRFEGKVLSGTVSRTADKWYISINVELTDPEIPEREFKAVGVDLGVKTLATMSDGTSVVGSKASRKYAKQLKRLNQSLSRKQGARKGEKKSANFVKTKQKLQRLYAKMANIRKDETHKLTTQLVQNYTLIGIEDLNVSGMLKNHRLARSVSDMTFFEFRSQLEYKAKTAGTQIVVANQWFPSTQLCSNCGCRREGEEKLTLGDRTYECKDCGFICDRDLNAAINLREYALKQV